MSISVALSHRTEYTYDRMINLGPHEIRLRPAPHCRTPILSYSLKVEPANQFLNWQQDPFGNYVARVMFQEKTNKLSVQVDVVSEAISINPFDFFIREDAEHFPFQYQEAEKKELLPYLECEPATPNFQAYLDSIDKSKKATNDFLVQINQQLQKDIDYTIRLEPGVQTCEETLTLRTGSCRDSAWVLVQLLRHLGLAARFVSGYLIQLTPDMKSLDGPSGAEADFTDLHAWTEVYLPGAGWIGLDATSGLLAGEGHIPLACTPHPTSAAPIIGAHDKAESTFDFEMSITRIAETPRVTKPYTPEQWQSIESLGHLIDKRLDANDVRLTMGGEPTFVSIDDMDGDEWNTAALGTDKKERSYELLNRLKNRFANGGLLHYGQGKWYPGEPLPRWAYSCYWRKDNEPLWNDPDLFADEKVTYHFQASDAEAFISQLAERLKLNADYKIPGYEDVWYYLWKEQQLPVNVDPLNSQLEDENERKRLARIFEEGLGKVVGYVLPIKHTSNSERPWQSGPWFFRREHMFLYPGDSPMGLRLPLDSIHWYPLEEQSKLLEIDPFVQRTPFGPRDTYLPQYSRNALVTSHQDEYRASAPYRQQMGWDGRSGWVGNGDDDPPTDFNQDASAQSAFTQPENDPIVRTALCVEVREGRMFVFMPPVEDAEHYLELITTIEETAKDLAIPVTIEGYPPPHDPRLNHFKITPDPGVIEVNIHPSENWDQLVLNTNTVYEEARLSRLGTEKFDLDGRHRGTGGGNHVVLGGPSPADSPFLRRPDLLRSMVGYWHNHPSLSYLFSGTFIGPTSQAPRIDEGRRDAIYELGLAFDQVPDPKEGACPPWITDRIFRNLLVDLTGNTHRAEFCIDKMYSPDSSTGRLGLVELRAFEMPPHSQMSLTQQLLIRSLLSWFWEHPYKIPPVDWGTSLHDRFLLPHFVQRDMEDVIQDLQQGGYPLEHNWFDPHFEFRFPTLGEYDQRDVHMELRQAIEPWYVLGEEQGAGGTARYVDSSVERLQIKLQGLTEERYKVLCNGTRIPLHPTGTRGEFIAGVRYRAWQPPHCLHPTIPVDTPLVFDLYDDWSQRSLGGCTYYVSHPGGRNPETFPVNALEAEGRRAARFIIGGHSPGTISQVNELTSREYPLTLDLRKTQKRH